jgi:carbonic anhydrase
MERRNFVKGLVALGVCPLCASVAAAEGAHWAYEGEAGPDHWGALGEENAACSVGSQQSPLDIMGATRAELPQLAIAWQKGGTIVNNGHTIQVNTAPGSTLTRGDKVYDLVQFHFHAPSEHMIEGQSFPMEAHFVHKHAETGGLGVLGVFLSPGAANATFAAIAAAFPAEEGGEGAVGDLDPAGLLPATLGYWAYEGSLTTPPCSEIVDWMVAMLPMEVAAEDIARFTDLYPMNARPVLTANRRFILASE